MGKRAVCVGINYLDTDAELAGCVNDADEWTAELTSRGFAVQRLTDQDATRTNILEALVWLASSGGKDDLLVFTYSGHGSWQPDAFPLDEADGRDEVLCPVDFDTGGVIVDDDLHAVLAAAHRWARIVTISDSCHSGTVNRLASPLATHGGAAEAVGMTFPPQLQRARFLPPSMWLPERQHAAARRLERAPGSGRPRGPGLLLAGCADTEMSMDAWFGGRAGGAFTRAALDTLQNPSADVDTYRDWHRQIRRRLPSVDFPQQTPQLSGSDHQRRWLTLEADGGQ